jgi:hypothetical protein
MTSRAAEPGSGRLPAQKQWRPEGDSADFLGTAKRGVIRGQATFGRLMRQVGGKVAGQQPPCIAKRQVGWRRRPAQESDGRD